MGELAPTLGKKVLTKKLLGLHLLIRIFFIRLIPPLFQ